MLSKYLILLPVLLAALVLSINLNKPFVGHHDFTSAFNGTIAKNYIKHGVWDLKFGQVTGFVEGDPANHKSFYTHYLPLLPLLISGSFLVFGINEWAERLIPLIFSLVGIISFFLICQKLWNKQVALIASIFYVFNPMFIYFGKMPVPEPVIVSLAMLSLYLYLVWIEHNKRKDLILLCLTIFIAGLIGWPIGYIPVLLILHSLMIKKFTKKLFIPLITFIMTIVLQFLHAHILTSNLVGGGIIESIRERTLGEGLSFGGINFNLQNYLRQELSWLQAYYTRIMLGLSFIYVLSNLNLKINIQKATLIVLLLFGLAHPVLFSRYVFVHDFLNIYLLPFLAISAALGLNYIGNLLGKVGLPKTFQIGITVLVLVIFIFERIEFTKTLLATDANKEGQEMANLLNSLAEKDKEVAIVSVRFSNFYGIFTNFYSNYSYVVQSEGNLKQDGEGRFKYIIMIEQDIKDKKFYEDLISRYKYIKKADITIINTHEKR